MPYADGASDSVVRGASQRQGLFQGGDCQELGRNKKTVDRLVARLRADGLLESEPVWDENGGQRANVYRLAHGGGGLVVQVME